MATLPQKSLGTFVADLVTAWAVQMGISPVFQSGDPLLAIMQAVAMQLLFIQAQVQLVTAISRAQTSGGADLDSFYGQFNFPRLQGVSPSGQETFSSGGPAVNNINIPAAVLGSNEQYVGGTLVQTPGGAIQYQAIPDTGNANYNAALNAYVLTAGQSSVLVTIAAVSGGSAANVSAGQLSQLASVVPGIVSVTNVSAIANGTSPESDAAYSARFILYLASLSKATEAAITEAIESVQPGIEFNLIENVDTNDNPRLGEFVAVIDDGTGSPPSGLITEVQTAISAVRGFTILALAKAVTPEAVPIVITVRVASGYVTGTVEAAVQVAIVAAANASLIGGTLFINAAVSSVAPMGGVENAALSVPGVVSVMPGTTINGVAADYTPTPMQAARITTSNVTVSTY